MRQAWLGWLRIWVPVALVSVAALAVWTVSRSHDNGPGQKSPGGNPASADLAATLSPEDALKRRLEHVFAVRASALINQNAKSLDPLYKRVSGKNDALEHERGRLRYMSAWAKRRGVKLTYSSATLTFQDVEIHGDTATVTLKQSAAFAYVPAKRLGRAAQPEPYQFGIGTRHRLELVREGGEWLILKDDYTDPLGEDTLVNNVTPACSPPATDAVLVMGPVTSTAGEGGPGRVTYDRAAAVRYADTYCGAAAGCGNAQQYNPRYKDLTDLGGDCTSFVSQVIGDPDGGRLPQTAQWHWNYDQQTGSVAWLQAVAFARHLETSGYATLIAKGRYDSVVKPTKQHPRGAILSLRPGDVIGYEEEGRIQHFSVVVGTDNRGQPVVNSHTSDRFHVPWDLGWDQKTIYWLYALP